MTARTARGDDVLLRSRSAWRLVLLFSWAAIAAGCGQALMRAVPREPIHQEDETSLLGVQVHQLLVGEELISHGVTEDAALGVTLRLENKSAMPYRLSVPETWLLLARDERHPEQTSSWAPAGGGEGVPPDDLADDLPLATLTIAPGEAREVWLLFRGYRFEDSDVPRRVTLVLPGPDGRVVNVRLADPSRGNLRWNAPSPTSQMMVSVSGENLGGHTHTQFAGSAVSRVARAGWLLWDMELRSGLVLQSEGKLVSSTSAFSVVALGAHLTAPFFTWGPWQNPGRLGVFAGGGGSLWTSIVRPAEAKEGVVPKFYGAWFLETGLELDLGTWQAAKTPFPLSYDARPGLPRWTLRLGYTQTWIDGGSAAGIMNAIRFSF